MGKVLSRDNINLPLSSNINFGSGLYTLPRLKEFSYSFVSVPTQNNGEYETDLAKKAKLEADSELLNRNLHSGYTGHIVDNIQNNIDQNRYETDYDYFCKL